MTPSRPQVYFPSCVVNLRLRFDEALQFNVEGAAAYSYAPADIVSKAESPDAPSGVPLFLANGLPDNLTPISGRIPKSASIELPAYRDAGKFSLTFDYRDLPIDPRLLRSCGVEIYLDTVENKAFSEGIVAPSPQGGERTSILTRQSRASQLTQSPDNLAMVGTVDSWSVKHSSSGSEVSVEGRDLRAIFLQSPLDPAILEKVDLKQNIVEVIRYIVSKHPFAVKVNADGSTTRRMDVQGPVAGEWPYDTIPSPGDKGGLTRVRKSADGQKEKASGGAQPDKLNYWDIITKYCQLVGAVPFFKGYTLWVCPARSLYAQLAANFRVKGARLPWVDAPFASRDVGESSRLYVRRLVHGRNIEELNFERKFNGFVPRTIHLVSLDTSSKQRGAGRLLEVYWPAKNKEGSPVPPGDPGLPAETSLADNQANAAVSQVSPSGKQGNKDEVRISVPGVTDKKRLLQIAQDLYEELGRGEQGGSVKTKNLASFGGGNEDPDLLRLRPGDAMELLVDGTALSTTFPVRSPLNDQQRQAPVSLTYDLAKRLGDANLATAIVATSRNYVAGLQNYFRVSNVKFDWDASSGVSVSFDFQNYLEARNAITPLQRPTGQNPRSK